MDIEKGTFVRVTFTEDFIVPDYDSNVDGTLEEWFDKHNLNGYHAYRDGSAIGGSKRFLSYKKFNLEEFEKLLKEEK